MKMMLFQWDELENKAYGDNDRLSAVVANAVDVY